jgi:hypothetical protein
MRKFQSTILYLTTSLLLLISCSSTYNNLPTEIKTKDATKYTTDYDDGSTIYINVKIAIDKKGWDAQTPVYFKEKLKEQWEQINARFNNSDKKHQLKRKYIFKPDLDDIIVYSGCSYWGENGANKKVIGQMDKNIFKLVVIYDFFYEGAENGEYGGGCGNDDGIGTILVINGSEGMKNKYNDHFGMYTYRAITHELGHFRGLIDLYADVVKAEDNPINGESYNPPHCLMNDYCYTPDEESSWSDYAIKIINKTGNIKQPNLIDQLMFDDFATKMIVKSTKNGKEIDTKVSFYPATFSYTTWRNSISKVSYCSFKTTGGQYELSDLKSLFFKSTTELNDRRQVFLVEAEAIDGTKKYAWISDFEMHYSGMNGNKTYELNFEF